MLHSDELFLYFAQVGKYAHLEGDAFGNPEFQKINFEKAYKNFLLTIQNPAQRIEMSNEVFQILKQLMTFDYMHDRVKAYIELEKKFRSANESHLGFDLETLEADLKRVTPLYEAQYSTESKSKLNPEAVPDHLLTGTAGRIVRLKDYLSNKGPSKNIPTAIMLNHKGREVIWP